jgi:1,4-dihydroxy-2-naphthoyl-CoA synthase
MSDYQDLIVTSEGGVATVAIDRPKVLNAMRAETVEELIRAIDEAGWDKSIGVIVLTVKALCRTDDPTIGIRRGRLDGPNLEMRRCDAAKLPLRGSQRPAHPRRKVVDA